MDEEQIVVEHHTNPPTDGARCLICLDPLEAPYVVIILASNSGWRIKADDFCWTQLNNMVQVAISGPGVITH